jgi:hypothetical protein
MPLSRENDQVKACKITSDHLNQSLVSMVIQSIESFLNIIDKLN